MRASILSLVALVSAAMHFQGSGEFVGAIAPRSSLGVPSGSSGPSVFGMPRGGAFAVSTKGAKVAPPSSEIARGGQQASSIKENIFKRIIKRKIDELIESGQAGWVVSFALSIIYLVLFFQDGGASTNACTYSSAGFCVTNFDGADCPIMNSHTWAFAVDMVFLVACFLVPSDRTTLYKAALAFGAVGSHGALHALLGIFVNCTSDPFPGAETIFGAFGALISFLILFSTTELDNMIKLVISAVSGYLTVLLSEGGAGVSSIFLITQLLASGAGIFDTEGKLTTPLMGYTFIAPCLVSIIELLFCCDPATGGPGLFNQYGGHVWYDIALHTSLLTSLLPRKDE
ncbi:unnamed protein product [Pseudo-nitzschia multistriata]|uniref:Peptidase S54 rhomboid domain-containing protein n=1 Tax=Pseudo-nitzschia multistriata TaxID=183589 RepID=A0A448ZTJ5_9STRA|nr:unnamed protein product [Pseudo-nitzschia multistriata]